MPPQRTRRNLWLDRAQWSAFQERTAGELLTPAVILEHLLAGYATGAVTLDGPVGPTREPGRGRTSVPLADEVYTAATKRADATGASLSVVCDALLAAYLDGGATVTVMASGRAAT